ncbi:MAG TPA: hypothetical protein DCP37_11940 [Dehalococcoidia bacterium]|jgi:NADH-quinone oxidoreductase subunit I|nr:hypothetical protein [Dehalococcoidia bacterium]|tara:strand:+ start:4004 stop:4639 length:636 start_codon:yes stop_codon:yes gene_type:complete
MVGFLEGLAVTLKTAFRRPVTAQYPEPNKRLPIALRYKGFPALMWDGEVNEPYCTGCMVCVRACPTQCMTAEMKDNPFFTDEKSRRRKIIDVFEINLGRCILCAICVDVCNFDAIEMSHVHELSKYQRNDNRVVLSQLLDMGKSYQSEIGWSPSQPEKNSGVPVKKEEGAKPTRQRTTKRPQADSAADAPSTPTTPAQTTTHGESATGDQA